MEQYDYESIRTRILTNLSNKTEHQNVFDNGAIVNIIEALSEELEDQMMQDEYLTTENNWSLAQNRSSLLTESKVHNYDVPRKRGATGNIRFSTVDTFDDMGDSIIDFPKWTQTSTDDGIDFTTIEATSLPVTDDYVDIPSVQGIHKTYSNFAQGLPDETFTIINDSIENKFYDLYVNNELWTAVDTLFDYTGTDKVYELRSLPDFTGVKIQFGNGAYGKALIENDAVRLEYVETLGSDGNIIVSNAVVNIDSTIFDVNGEQVDVFCTNTSSLSGGESEASIEEIRVDSPRFFQSGDRATSIPDYETIINSFSYIKKVVVTGAYEYNLDNGNDLWEYIPTEDNLLRVIALSTTDKGLTEDEAIQLTTDIRKKNAPTDILTYPEISIIPMKFNMDVAVNSRSYTLSEVKSSIITNLENAYNLDNFNFYESIYSSDFDALVDNTEGVRKHNSYITLLQDLEFASPYATSVNLPLFPILGEDIKVYVKLKIEEDKDYILIAQGDTLGFLQSEAGYTLSSLSRIGLTTGVGTLAVLSGLEEEFSSYDVRIEYRLTTDDIELTSRTQILKYQESNFTNIEYYKNID